MDTLTFTEQELKMKFEMAFMTGLLRISFLSSKEGMRTSEEMKKILDESFRLFTA